MGFYVAQNYTPHYNMKFLLILIENYFINFRFYLFFLARKIIQQYKKYV